MSAQPKYFLYARKSTEDDDKQVMSIEAQLFELREFARKENLEILQEFQESKSAKTPGRIRFAEVMSRIESGEAQGILAWHPDRLARNSIDGGRIIYAVDTRKIVSLRFPTFWFEPTPQGFDPILSPTLFEAVQKKLHERARPRHHKESHNFPFVGLFRCGECHSMITAQWTTGKSGGKYRYYRCTKKNGHCTQKYLQEDALAMQTKERLQSVSLPDDWVDHMLSKVEGWDKEDKQSSGSRAERMKSESKEIERKLDALVDLHLNGDIERAIYLRKKDILQRQKLSLDTDLSSVRRGRKNWVEPLRQWILDSKHARFLASSTNYPEIRDFVRSFGSNPTMRDKTISISFSPPSDFARIQMQKCAPAPSRAPSARGHSGLSADEVSECDPTGNRTPI